MSTRATYTIENDFGAGNIQAFHFYIHHDGYHEGAASYFYNMIDLTTSNGGMAERFLRANTQASLIANPARHGDTEFHYTLRADGKLEIKERIDFSDEWKTSFMWLTDFVNSTGKFGEGCFTVTWSKWGNGSINYSTTQELLLKAYRNLDYVENHPEAVGNISSSLNSALKNTQLISSAYENHPKTEMIEAYNVKGISASLAKIILIMDDINTQRYSGTPESKAELSNMLIDAIASIDVYAPVKYLKNC